MMTRRAFIYVLLSVCLAVSSAAQDIQRATLYGIGFADEYDSYLSPQAYRGMELRISRESLRNNPNWLRKHPGWVQLTQFQSHVNYTENQAENNNTIAALANWNWSILRQFQLAPNLAISVGPAFDINGGFTYNLRNGNNPAQAKAYASVGANVMLEWNTHIKSYPLTLRYSNQLPLMGAMFMPHYGQSYYEIFSQGNNDGVVCFTHSLNSPSLRQQLSADLPIGKSTIRLAYLWDAQQADVNNVKSHSYSHLLMVGFVKKFNIVK